MTERATVVDIRGSRVTLECREEEKCKACTSGFCTVKKGRQIIARNGAGLELKKGDTVDVYVPTGRTIFAGFMVLIFPLILFFCAYVTVERLVAGVPEAMKLLAGFGGIAAGFLLNYVLGKFGKNAEMPMVKSLSAAHVGADEDDFETDPAL